MRYWAEVPERLWLVDEGGRAVLKEEGAGNVRRSVVPDGLCGFQYPDGEVEYLILERCRGTIPIQRTQVRRHGGIEKATPDLAHVKSISGKLLTYWRGWNKRVLIAIGGKKVWKKARRSLPKAITRCLTVRKSKFRKKRNRTNKD